MITGTCYGAVTAGKGEFVTQPIIETVCTRRGLLALNRAGQSWRAIGALYGVNQKYVYEFAKHGIIPTNDEICYRMGLKVRPEVKAGLAEVVKFLAARDPGFLDDGPKVYNRKGERVKV